MALGQSLLRREAIDFQRGQRDFGEIATLQPVSTKLLAWLLTAVIAVAIVLLCFAQFSRKQAVPGYLIPASGTMKVFPRRAGVVTDLYVGEGHKGEDQRVEAAEAVNDGSSALTEHVPFPHCAYYKKTIAYHARKNATFRRKIL